MRVGLCDHMFVGYMGIHLLYICIYVSWRVKGTRESPTIYDISDLCSYTYLGPFRGQHWTHIARGWIYDGKFTQSRLRFYMHAKPCSISRHDVYVYILACGWLHWFDLFFDLMALLYIILFMYF